MVQTIGFCSGKVLAGAGKLLVEAGIARVRLDWMAVADPGVGACRAACGTDSNRWHTGQRRLSPADVSGRHI
jgi:hypothetical protein